mmetsp:Transcript_929/g.1449  ORF Transcript_929/g.1449 Transcript_929/m.1449 type:complete len:98 (-) Transcript_929:127-420(-)
MPSFKREEKKNCSFVPAAPQNPRCQSARSIVWFCAAAMRHVVIVRVALSMVYARARQSAVDVHQPFRQTLLPRERFRDLPEPISAHTHTHTHTNTIH